MTVHAEDVVIAGAAAICAVGVIGLRLLDNPTSRLSRWLNGKVDTATLLPQDARRVTR